MKATLLVIITFIISGCTQPKPQQSHFTQSELIANCIEDAMDTIVVPSSITGMAKYDYKLNIAKGECNENL